MQESRRAYRHLQTLSGRRSVHVLVFLGQSYSDRHQSVLHFEIVRFSSEGHDVVAAIASDSRKTLAGGSC